jgi:hypothetical protein
MPKRWLNQLMCLGRLEGVTLFTKHINRNGSLKRITGYLSYTKRRIGIPTYDFYDHMAGRCFSSTRDSGPVVLVIIVISIRESGADG